MIVCDSYADHRNHPDHLDPALSRAGRFDVHIPFASALPVQARALFLHFYPIEDFIRTSKDGQPTEKGSAGVTSVKDLERLATAFVDAIFPTNSISIGEGGEDTASERTSKLISMAALQAYLLKHKDDPQAAVDHAPEWIETFEPELVRSNGLAPPLTPVVKQQSKKVGPVPLRKKALKKAQDQTNSEAPSPALDADK